MDSKLTNPSTDDNFASRVLRGEKIDASKDTLFEVLFDPKLDQLSFDSRLKILDLWHNDLQRKNLTLYQRYSTDGCKTERNIVNPSSDTSQMLINFGSNDYLNMSQHPSVIHAAIKALEMYGAGAGAACNASGQTIVKLNLEKEIADTFNYTSALVFPTGYATNVGVLQALLRSNDIAIIDMNAHASIMDGVVGKNKMLFKHNDMGSLENVLSRAHRQYMNKIVVVDGVYSMDGDIANLPEISALCKKYNALLMVDEAHAFGVIGKNGLGILEHFNMPSESVDILVGTLSKSVGCSGGFVTGKKELINYLELSSRSYMFSTGPFIASTAAALESIKTIKQNTSIVNKLQKNTTYFKLKLKQAGFNIGETQTAIFPIILGNHNKVIQVTKVLGHKGILANVMPYPSVQRKQTRIRMTVTAEMTLEQLNKGYTELCSAIEKYDRTQLPEDELPTVSDPASIEYQLNISAQRRTLLAQQQNEKTKK